MYHSMAKLGGRKLKLRQVKSKQSGLVRARPLLKLEATTGFEPVNGGFANLWLTTCLRRQRSPAMRDSVVGQVRS